MKRQKQFEVSGYTLKKTEVFSNFVAFSQYLNVLSDSSMLILFYYKTSCKRPNLRSIPEYAKFDCFSDLPSRQFCCTVLQVVNDQQ